ncbi:MAG: methionyl-tRNA formyltransferase [Candidatus Paceibacterota bacterium]|jgi:methionyl-tRNA formyltransferase
MEKTPRIAFFGTPDRAVIALDQLKHAGTMPALIVTQPDRPQGRKLVMTAPLAKSWAIENNISVLQPDNLADEAFLSILRAGDFDAFVVVAYGKILRKAVLDIPKHGCLNLHASLLPRLRGSSPIETAILRDERKTGVTIILMDELMDHGPILAQKVVEPATWPISTSELATLLVTEGGRLMAETLPRWIDGSIKAQGQNHAEATVTKKIIKEDGLMDLSADPYQNLLKYNAYKGWPSSFFFREMNGKSTRIVITEATLEDGKFIIKKVIPEGRKEISWSEIR